VSENGKSKSERYTILVVDDEENVLRSIERLFRREPYRVLTTGDPEEALRIAGQEPIHLVMADQRMPGMTGIELVQRMKEAHPDVMRIVFTGYVDMNTAIDAINKGEVFRFVTKPWQDTELRSVVRQALTQYELVAENIKLMGLIERQNLRLRQLNQQLEEEIADRTGAIKGFLERKNQELTDVLASIRSAQEKLVRSEDTIMHFLHSLGREEQVPPGGS